MRLRGFKPPRPSGSDNKVRFDQWVWDLLTLLTSPISSKTVKVNIGSYGISWDAIVASVAGSGGRLGPFQIDSVQDDYLTCYAYDPVKQERTSTTPVYIAKEDKHQNSLATETIFGVAHNYTYQAGTAPPGGLAAADANNVFRTDTYGGKTEYQRIVPPWVCGAEGDLIWAESADTGVTDPNDKPVSLQIAGRSCQWAIVNS